MYSVLKYGVQWQRSSLLNIWRKKTQKKNRCAYRNVSFILYFRQVTYIKKIYLRQVISCMLCNEEWILCYTPCIIGLCLISLINFSFLLINKERMDCILCFTIESSCLFLCYPIIFVLSLVFWFSVRHVFLHWLLVFYLDLHGRVLFSDCEKF